MSNLNLFGVSEMTKKEMENTEGGSIFAVIICGFLLGCFLKAIQNDKPEEQKM